jgi:hypothetical protein
MIIILFHKVTEFHLEKCMQSCVVLKKRRTARTAGPYVYNFSFIYKHIVTCMGVTVDWVWIGNRIYRTLTEFKDG